MYHRLRMPASRSRTAASAVPDLLGVLSTRQRQSEQAAAAYIRPVANPDEMLYWLAKACKEARLAAGRKLVHIGASADKDQTSIWRFEKGLGWPRETDLFIAAYADDLDVTPMQLWLMALEMWQNHQGEVRPLDPELSGRPVGGDGLPGPGPVLTGDVIEVDPPKRASRARHRS
jgi:hypothetical protein